MTARDRYADPAPEPKPGTPLHSLAVLMAQARIRIAREAAQAKLDERRPA